MFKTYFDTAHINLLIIALVLLFFSILSFNYKKLTLSLALLLISGFIIRVFIITLDPFLNTWDEQIHALVAKNMMVSPFKPMFFSDIILPINFKNWIGNSVWLHKQPLFLWQMAISMKIFGVNEIAIRIPSLIISSLMILIIYRTASITLNKSIAYIAAVLFAFGNFSLELVSGWCNTDHNDVAFMFYVSASICAWVEYVYSKKKRWLIIIGVFAGAAVLVKWLTGLLVFFIWFIYIVIKPDERKKTSSYLKILLSACIAFVVFLPWNIYTLIVFPIETSYELKLNSQHLLECVEGHCGNWLYHINQIDELYWKGAKFLLIPAMIILYKLMKRKVIAIAFIAGIIIIYSFYSVAQTKMPAFTAMINLLIYIAFATLFWWFFNSFTFKYAINKHLKLFLYTIALFVFSIYNLNIERIQYIHTNWNPNQANYRFVKMYNKNIYQKINKYYPENKYVIFGVNYQEQASCMFYTSRIAYDFIPDKKNIDIVLKKGKFPLIIRKDSLPEYIIQNKKIILIDYYE